MADTLIFKIDTTPTVSALQDVNDLLTQSKNKLKELTDAGKTQTDEYIAQTAVVKAYEKEQRSLNNVLVQQQGAVKVMTKLTEENIKAGKAQENSIAENRKAYNALYNQLLQTAKPTKEQIATAKQLNTVLKEQEAALGNTSRNVGNYGQGFDELTGKLTSIVPGLKGFQTAQAGVNAVMNANPIGGVVMLFTALQEILGKNAEVADQLEFAMAGINKVFSVVVDLVVDGVKQFGFLADAFDKPGETIKKLGAILQENLLNRFKALGGFVEAISQVFEGNFSKAAETASNAALQLGTGVVGLGSKIKSSYQEGAKAAMILDELSETIGRNELAIEKNNIAIENNKILLAQRGKADELRKKAAEIIIKLEEENAAKRVSIARTELQALNEELKGRTLSGEQKLQILRAEAKVEKETADGIAATRKARVEIEKLLNGDTKEESNKLIETKNKEKDALLKIDEEYNQAIKKQQEDKVKADEKRMADEAKMFEESQAAQAARLKAYQDAKAKEVEAAQKAADEQAKIEQTRLQVASQFVNAISNLVTASGEQSAAAVAFQKLLALSQIAINTAQSISAGIAGATTSATATGPGAFVATPIFIASTIATILGAVASATAILKQAPTPPTPAFATGVIGLDGPGTATSDSIDARLSRGESVMTAKATERFAPVLAQMEMAVGNRPNFQLGNRKFATGYIPTTDGGYSDRAMSNEVNNASTMAKMFSDSIAKMPQPKLVYDEFTNFVNNRNQSVNLSEL
jgi:hypothetical protein